MICKKIESQEYLSWKSFVDDFEYICNDVMCYYQRNTMSWKAAKNMLHRGRIYLDQVAKRANWNFCCFTKTDEWNRAQNLEAFNNQNASLGNAVALELKQNNIKWDEEIPFCSLPRTAPMQPDVTKDVQQLKTGGNLCVQEDECPLDHSFSNLANATLCTQQKLDNCSTAVLGSSNLCGLSTKVDDTVVDITGSELWGMMLELILLIRPLKVQVLLGIQMLMIMKHVVLLNQNQSCIMDFFFFATVENYGRASIMSYQLAYSRSASKLCVSKANIRKKKKIVK